MLRSRAALPLLPLIALACGPATQGLGSAGYFDSDGSETAASETGGSEASSAEAGDGDGTPGDGDGAPGDGDGSPGDGDGDGDGDSLCGNGMIDPGEDCEGNDLNGMDCVLLDFGSGTLACDPSCMFDTSSCEIAMCGNGILEPGEQCDGFDIDGANCIEMGQGPGLPTCTDQCSLDLSTCGIDGEGDDCFINACGPNLYCFVGLFDYTCYDGSQGDPCSTDEQCLSMSCSGGIGNKHCD